MQECRSSWVHKPDNKSLQYFLSYYIILCSVLLVWQQPPHPINNAVCLGLKTLFGGRCWQIMWAFKKCLHFPWILIRWKTHLLSHAMGSIKERPYCSKCYQHIRQTNRVPEEEVEESTPLHSSAAYVCLIALFICLRNPRMYSFKSVVMMYVPVAL